MGTTPPAEELLRKIEKLEAGHAHLKQEMSQLKLSGASEARAEHGHRQRSHSMSPQRSRLEGSRRKVTGGRGFDGPVVGKKGSNLFKQSSPLQRESRDDDPQNGGEAGSVDFVASSGCLCAEKMIRVIWH